MRQDVKATGDATRNENRRYPRVKSRFPVCILLAGSKDVIAAQTIDISSNGLLLELASDDAATFLICGDDRSQQTLQVRLVSPFMLPDMSKRVSDISFRVVRSTVTASGCVRIGLQNNALEGDDFALIDPRAYMIPHDLETQFLRIIEHLNVELPNKMSRVLVLTSAAAGAGVSTLAWWLSGCLARMPNNPTLYMDGNLRPRLMTQPEDPVRGLLEVLLEREGFEDVVVRLGFGAPDILNTGGEEGFLGSEVTEQAVRHLLARLRTDYRHIIIDALPSTISPLTLAFAKQADGIFVVIESGVTDRDIAANTVEHLHQSEVKVLGVILNKRDARSTG